MKEGEREDETIKGAGSDVDKGERRVVYTRTQDACAGARLCVHACHHSSEVDTVIQVETPTSWYAPQTCHSLLV